MTAQHEIYNSFKFYKPRTVWLMCVFASFLMFFDQGTTFANINSIREDPVINAIEDKPDYSSSSSSTSLSNSTFRNSESALSTTASGIFSCIFMLGFVFGTPLAASLLGTYGSNALLKFGIVGWVFSVLAVSCAPEYYSLVVFRFLVGFLEGFYSPFLVTIIDNIATKKDKMIWLAIFYAMMPVCSALGMFVSSEIASHVKIETDLVTIPGWRVGFFIEIPLGIILAVLMLGLPDAYNIYKATTSESDEQEKTTSESNGDRPESTTAFAHATLNQTDPRFSDEKDDANDKPTSISVSNSKTTTASNQHQDTFISFGSALRELMCHNLDYALIVVGYGAFDFLVTSFSSFAIVMLVQGPYDVSLQRASVVVGLPMALCGVIGTIVGGEAINRLGGIDSKNGISKCVGFPLLAILIGLPLGVGACMMQTVEGFLLLFIPCVIFVTMNTAGIGIPVLNVCPRNLRAYASSMMLLVMNGLGDLPAPVFVGFLSKQFFSGDYGNAGSLEHCNFLRDLQRNETVRMSETGEQLNFIESTWWWKGECKWNVASLAGQESYCANTSQINRALVCAVFLCFIVIPCWGLVVWRKWGTTIQTAEKRPSSIVADEKTRLLK